MRTITIIIARYGYCVVTKTHREWHKMIIGFRLLPKVINENSLPIYWHRRSRATIFRQGLFRPFYFCSTSGIMRSSGWRPRRCAHCLPHLDGES